MSLCGNEFAGKEPMELMEEFMANVGIIGMKFPIANMSLDFKQLMYLYQGSSTTKRT